MKEEKDIRKEQQERNNKKEQPTNQRVREGQKQACWGLDQKSIWTEQTMNRTTIINKSREKSERMKSENKRRADLVAIGFAPSKTGSAEDQLGGEIGLKATHDLRCLFRIALWIRSEEGIPLIFFFQTGCTNSTIKLRDLRMKTEGKASGTEPLERKINKQINKKGQESCLLKSAGTSRQKGNSTRRWWKRIWLTYRMHTFSYKVIKESDLSWNYKGLFGVESKMNFCQLDILRSQRCTMNLNRQKGKKRKVRQMKSGKERTERRDEMRWTLFFIPSFCPVSPAFSPSPLCWFFLPFFLSFFFAFSCSARWTQENKEDNKQSTEKPKTKRAEGRQPGRGARKGESNTLAVPCRGEPKPISVLYKQKNKNNRQAAIEKRNNQIQRESATSDHKQMAETEAHKT